MARFRLRAAHYLKTDPPTQFEQKEVSQQTGKQAIHRYEVPMFLDTNDPADHNYPGEIIVATEKSRAFPRDIIFTSGCTPDMEPLDDEAEEMKAKIDFGAHPIESLPANGETYGDKLVELFTAQMRSLEAKLDNVGGRGPDRVADLEARLAEKLASVEALEAKLSALLDKHAGAEEDEAIDELEEA